eukprot:2456190-Pleurochrysis_carterae.AAC.1
MCTHKPHAAQSARVSVGSSASACLLPLSPILHPLPPFTLSSQLSDAESLRGLLLITRTLVLNALCCPVPSRLPRPPSPFCRPPTTLYLILPRSNQRLHALPHCRTAAFLPEPPLPPPPSACHLLILLTARPFNSAQIRLGFRLHGAQPTDAVTLRQHGPR